MIVMANSVLCVRCGKWFHGRCVSVNRDDRVGTGWRMCCECHNKILVG